MSRGHSGFAVGSVGNNMSWGISAFSVNSHGVVEIEECVELASHLPLGRRGRSAWVYLLIKNS